MSKQKKPGGRGKADAVATRLDKLLSLAESEQADEHMPEIIAQVEWLVDRGLEDRLYDLMDDEGLGDDAYEALDFALTEAGYRLVFTMPADPAPPGDEPAPRLLIPFALTFVVPVRVEDLAKFPTDIQESARRLAGDRRFRKVLGLRRGDDLALDPRLYRVELDEWREESTVRRYLKGLARGLARPGGRPAALTDDDGRPQVDLSDEEGVPHIILVQRAFCGAAVTAEGARGAALEERLFETSERAGEDALAWVGDLLKEEMNRRGLNLDFPPLFFPDCLELHAVPAVAFRFRRMIEVTHEIEMANERFIANAPTNRTIEPVLYVSHHGEDYPEEIRMAAYPSDADDEEPYFTYVWEIDHDLETPEEVSDTIIEVAGELNARITLVDGLLGDERCDDCNGKLFHGPGGQFHSVD